MFPNKSSRQKKSPQVVPKSCSYSEPVPNPLGPFRESTPVKSNCEFTISSSYHHHSRGHGPPLKPKILPGRAVGERPDRAYVFIDITRLIFYINSRRVLPLAYQHHHRRLLCRYGPQTNHGSHAPRLLSPPFLSPSPSPFPCTGAISSSRRWLLHPVVYFVSAFYPTLLALANSPFPAETKQHIKIVRRAKTTDINAGVSLSRYRVWFPLLHLCSVVHEKRLFGSTTGRNTNRDNII